jgi:uncharacterized protein (TIGR02145 family)
VKSASRCGFSCTDLYRGDTCEIPWPQITSCNMVISACTSRWQILSATEKFRNKDWITYNGWVQCDMNDIIVCTWNKIWCQLAACNVWAITATSEACKSTIATSLNTWNCTTDKMWLHFQWWSSVGYKFEEEYTLSTSYNYSVDSWLTQGSPSTEDMWLHWPCPTGYHIPSPQEWYEVVEAWSVWTWWTLWNASNSSSDFHTTNSRRTLSSFWWSDIRIALMLPAAGYRSMGLMLQGSNGHYWSSIAHASTTSTSRFMYFTSNIVLPGYDLIRRNGFSLRCFKD